MSTTTPTSVVEVCQNISTISTNRFTEAITHYELSCGVTASEIVEMTPTEITLGTTFEVNDTDTNAAEARPTSRLALGWHLFSHESFDSGGGWTTYSDRYACLECVIEVTGDTCPECGAERTEIPSMPDRIHVHETITFDTPATSIDTLEERLSSVFNTEITVR